MVLTLFANPGRADEPAILQFAVNPDAMRAVVRAHLGRSATRALRGVLAESGREQPEVTEVYGAGWLAIDGVFELLRVLSDSAENDAELAEVLAALNRDAPLRALAFLSDFGGCVTMQLSLEGPGRVRADPVASSVEGCSVGDPSRVAHLVFEF